MSISSDGILCYGFQIKDEDGDIIGEGETPEFLKTSLDDDDDDDSEPLEFDDLLANIAKINSPDVEYDEHSKEEYEEYWGKKHELERVCPVELVIHCSFEYGMYILAIKESHSAAYRGYPVELGKQITTNPAWDSILRNFCKEANIPFEEPGWVLASLYG